MSSGFQLGIIPTFISDTLTKETGRNIEMSKKMAWLRISSALYTTGLSIQSFPGKSTFADKYGTSTRSGNIGVDFKCNAIYVDNDRAHRPSPSINGLSIQNGNEGLSRKASFSVTCYTLKQAEKLAEYLMEPGYTLLIEFGWNSIDSLKQLNTLDACEIARHNNYEYIKTKREKSKGQYDGFMGYIVGGGFTNGADDTYIIDVEVMTMGEIPTYLQAQKKTNPEVTDTEKNTELVTNNTYKVSEIDTTSSNVGPALFQQMFNDLPGIKQTQQTKDLINKLDRRGNPWSHKGNFINIDETIRTKIMEQLSGNIVADNKTVKIPDGLQIISEQSFIRLELAFEILNQFGSNLTPIGANGCDVETMNYRIDTSRTILRAHKHMFSIDGTKLFIPNKNLPDFGLVNALTATDSLDTSKLIDVKNPTIVSDANFFGDDRYAFPQQTGLTDPEKYVVPETVPIRANANEWGFLDDLYVNYSFFLEVINRSNYIAKDVYYELLNGISAAANSYWEFHIMDLPQQSNLLSTRYPHQMVVRDATFSGRIGAKVDADAVRVNGQPIPRFYATGVDSPFLNTNLNIEIPAAKRNSILGKRSSKKQEVLTEGQTINISSNVFARAEDPVIAILNSFNQPLDNEATSGVADANSGGTTTSKVEVDQTEIRTKNLEFFMNRATIIPTVQSRDTTIDLRSSFWTRNSSKDKLGAIVLVGAWNDPSMFKALEVQHEEKVDGEENCPAILGIEFKFDIMGLSGLKIGDMFQIRDLPNEYKNGIFQVMSIEHNLSDNLWKTSVTSRQRNI
jgi:hypothetical protein